VSPPKQLRLADLGVEILQQKLGRRTEVGERELLISRCRSRRREDATAEEYGATRRGGAQEATAADRGHGATTLAAH